MANKYWWEEDNEQTTSKSTSQTKSNSSSQSSKKYWWEEDSEKSSSGLWWDDGTTAKTIGSNVSSRVNEWLNSHNSYISDYQSRYEGRKFGYEDSYVSDSADWLTKAKERKSGFDTEAESILSYLDQYSGYLDADWVNKVKKTIADAQKSQGAILDSYTKDNEWWSGFGSEEMVQKYGSAEEAYKYHQRSDGYSKKYAGQTSDQLAAILDSMEDGEEKDWLASYKGSVYHDEMLKLDTATAESDIATLEQIMEDYIHADWYHSVTQAHPEATIDSDGQALLARYEEYRQKYGSLQDLEKRIQKTKQDVEYAKKNQAIASMTSVATGSEDFGEKSQYVSNVKYGLFGKPEFTDNTYAYINNPTVEDNRPFGAGDATARELLVAYGWNTPTRYGDSAYKRDALEQISKEEVKVYNYYYATQGPEKAQEYLDLLVDTFRERQLAETFEKVSQFAGKHPVIASALSVGTSIGSGFEYIEDLIDYGGKKLFGQDAKLDKNESAMVTNAVRNAVTEKVDWEIGNWDAFDFLYNTTMSGVDSMASTVFGPAGGVVLGLSAAAQGTNDALSRGMSDGQAFWNGLFTGVFEGLFESVSIGNFNKLKEVAPKGIKDIFKNLGKSMLVNASEETLTEIANIGYDTLVNGEFANYTMEDLKNGAWKQALNQVIEAGASGALMGVGMSALGTGIGYAGGIQQANAEALKQYGDKTDVLIQEGLGNDTGSNSYKLAQKYQQQTQGKNGKEGKALTGQQIRKLLAANQDQVTAKDRKLIQQAAEKRLTDLGQTEDVSKLAEIATRYATGQKVSKAEKSFLANSKYGSRVYNELLPKNIASGEYSTAWAEEIGTKQVNAVAYNIRKIIDSMTKGPNTYKALDERVGKESKLNVSKSGQATIQESGEAFDIKKAEVVSFTTDEATGKITDVTFKTESGTEVQASGIDFADSDQSYLVEAVSKIENITPDAATVAVHSYDPSTGQTVGEYLNGFDEAYTYGYNKYPESDLKAGNFTHKLTNEQMMIAYRLGQSAKKISGENKAKAIKRMRTASQVAVEKAIAEGKAAPNTNGLTITYNKGGGNVVSVDEANANDAQSGGIEVAKVLHKLGLGTRVELFSSYITKDEHGNKIRVFRDDNGVEQRAYSGVYRKSDGTIRIDLNAYNGKGLTLYALSHELTHFIQQWSTEKYEALADFLVKTYEGTDMTMHDRVVKEQARLERIRRKGVSYSEAYDEVVANAMSKMFDDGKLVEKLAKLKEQDKTLAQKLWEGFKEIMSKFMGFYQNESLFQDADVLVDMKETFEKLQDLFAEALVEASDNFQASQQIGLEIDTATESVSPAVMYSEHTWTESDYVQERDKAAKEIAKAIGVSEKKAKDYIDSINSIAKMIAEDRSRLDYFSSPGRSSFVDNAEYGGSFDFSTLCKKRRLLTGTFTAIQKALPNTALTADEILDIRNRMKKANLEVSCGLCYVEGSRANMGQFAKEFLRLYKQYYPDAWQPNMADVNTPDGIEWVRINHPECYEQYEYFWNHYGTLKEGDKNLFASQQKPKLYQLHTEYKGEILNKFKNDDKVEDKNLNGGIRLQSFSDFEIVHLIDTMQIIMDMSRVGLAGQAYTKVPDFAWALGDTGLKINLSLIAKGVDANGKLIFDDVEGMPIAEAMKLRDRYSKNVGTILVAFNDEQLLAAMADDRVDFIIPFHRSQWKKSQYEAMGLPAKTKDYTFVQNEKYIKPQFHEYRGRMVKDKATNYMPNEYWDFSKSGKENAEAYLEMCARNNKRPKFYKLLQNNGDGSYSLKADGSTDGYWKLLIDFKMYDNDGNGSRQMPVKPEFNMEEANRMLETYKGGHSNFPVAQGIVDGFVKDYKASHKGEQYSEHDTDFDKDFDYSGLNWASDLGIITGKDRAIFERTINNEIFRGAKPQSANGEYIIDTGKCLMFTDGDFHRPTLSRVIVFVTEYESLLDEAKRRILYEAGSTGDVQVSQRIIENLYGPGFAVEYTPEIHGAYAWQNRRGERTNGKGSGRGYHAKSLKERFAEEGLSHLLEDDDEVYSEHETDYSNRSLLANAFEGITNGSDEYKLIQKYKGYIAELNSLENKLSEMNAEIRKIRFGKGEYDAEKLARLESEAKKIAEAISKYDQYLLSLEASEPLRKVIERERKKEAQKTRDYVKEIQQNKKVRAEQTELRHKIRRAVRDLDKIFKHGNKQKNVKEDLQQVVTKALKAADILFTENYGNYDMLRNGIGADLSDAEEALVASCARMLKDIDAMPTDGYENFLARQEAEKKLSAKMSKLKDVFARERKRLNNTTVSSILGDLADAYATLENSKQSYVQGAYNEAVHNFLKNLQSEVGGAIVQDMTKDQLESVYAAYKMVLNTVRNANRMFNEELKQSREQLSKAVIDEVIKAGGVHLLGSKLGTKISQFDWNNMKPIWLANRIGSETFGKLMQGLFNGQYNFAVDIAEVKDFKLKMDEKYHPRDWDAEKLYEFESSTGKKFSLNLQQIMSLYAFSKREQAYNHLLNGGFAFEKNSTVIVEKNGKKKAYIHKGASTYKLNEATLNGIINTLTAEQKAYADEMQKYLSETMGAKGNEVSMQLYGIRMFNEQFYFPLRSSGDFMEKAKAAELKKQEGQINLVNSGFTHAVKPQAKNPIILSGFMDVWAEHCNEMSMYHSMVLPMEDFRKVYNYSTVHDDKLDSASVQQTIIDAYGDEATKYIDQLYRELNAGATVDPRENFARELTGKFKKAAVMLSASVVVQQFSSIGRAYALIDPKHFIGAKVNSGTNLSAVEEMKKYAPVAIIKEMGGFDTGTKGSAKSYIMAEKYDKGERIKGLVKDEQYRSDIMGYLPAKADQATWIAIWEAAKRETKAKHSNMDVKSEEFLQLAGERFSEVIEKTQVYDSVLARSANMRSKSGLMQMATAFMAEPTTTINLLEDAIRSGKARNIARTFGSVAVSIVLNNALASIVYAMRDDDEDESFLEKYFQSFTSGLIDDINPMTYYPFLKDVYSLLQGYDVERADMSVIADVRDALKKAVSLLGKDTSEMDDEELAEHWKNVNGVLVSLLDAGCSMFGVPVKNVRRDAMGIINAWNTLGKDISGERTTTWRSFWDKVGAAAKDTIPVYAWTKDKAKADKLYEAIISGDRAYLDRLKSTYKTDDAYTNAIRKALRENDPRIHAAAQARYDGKTEEYKRIFREIKNEGKFSFDDIMSAVNSEVSKIRNGVEPDKVTSSYTASGFVEALVLGDTKNAQVMMEDIVAAKVANGKTHEDAEKEFKTDVATGIGEAYYSGLLDQARAKEMLMEYAGKDEEEAATRVSYWAFCEKYPKYKDILNEANVAKYHEFAEPAEIPVDVYAQYITGTRGLETIKDEWGDEVKSKREQVLEVIDSLPLTWQQKDALYLAHEYSENTIWDVPW